MNARLLMLTLPAAAIALVAAAPAKVVTYSLPDTEVLTLPAGEGSELAAANCAACHSLDYIRSQPRGKGAQFWTDEVHKMIAVYGAPIEAADEKTIAVYLAKTYGKPAS